MANLATPVDQTAKAKSPLVGDLSGGLASAIVSLVGNVAAGVIAFAPLGPQYAGQAILAGMFASIVGGLAATLVGRAPGMIVGPKASTAMVFASLLGQLIAAGQFDLTAPEEVRVVLTLAFTAVLLSGVIQFALGSFRVGGVVTFIPYPVVAGIRNAAGLLLILSQVWPFLGMSRGPLWEIPFRWSEVQPATLAVASVTALLIWRGDRFIARSIVPIVALVVGSALHHILVASPWEFQVGPVLGALPSAFPTPEFAGDIAAVVRSPELLSLLPIVLAGALAIAVMDSVTALISLVAFQGMAGQRLDANRHLVGIGLGNVLAAPFGGLSSSGLFARAAVNHKAGGRTVQSGVANAIWVLVLLLIVAGPIGFVPKAALAGLIVVVAIGLFDPWSLELAREALLDRQTKRQDLWTNLFEMLFVVAVGVAFNLVAAVAAGVVISILTFVARMSRTPIRRTRRGSTLRSKRQRDHQLTELLQQHGDRIAVLELEGTVFFGSSNAVAQAMERLAGEGVDYLIVDLKRVRQIDVSGFKVLGDTASRLARTGVRVAFGYTGAGEENHFREGLTVSGGLGDELCFSTTDQALEAFEDRLLAELDADPAARDRWSIERFAKLLELEGEEQEVFAGALREHRYPEGQMLCRIGEPGNAVFFLADGSADVSIPIEERGRSLRLSTLDRGTLFGEMSLLDGRPRSADVRTREALVCYELTTEAFRELAEQHPKTAMKIFAAIGRILGARLREANELIHELDV